MKNVLIVDSHNMLHRARFGFGDGEYKIFFNFFRMLKGEMQKHKPDIVYIVDEGSPSLSRELSADYKANRQKLNDVGFSREKSEIFEVIKQHSGLIYARHEKRECDDVIGYLASEFHKDDCVTIVSTDTDFIQLINDKTKLWNPKHKKYTDPWFCDYVTWKALRGDPTDNIAGVAGVGGKRADQLATDPESFKAFFEKSPEKLEQFNLSYELVKLKLMPHEEIEFIQSDFCEENMHQEFSFRKCNTIIGKAWASWVNEFNSAGGKVDFGH
jgi:5'-3' exonuclease